MSEISSRPPDRLVMLDLMAKLEERILDDFTKARFAQEEVSVSLTKAHAIDLYRTVRFAYEETEGWEDLGFFDEEPAEAA